MPPSINRGAADRSNVAGRANVVTGTTTRPTFGPPTTPRLTARINPNSTMPYARYSPNLYPVCEAANRDSNGQCIGKPVSSGDGGGGKLAKKGKGNNPSSNSSLAGTRLLSFTNQLVAEIDGSLTDAQTDELARRYGLVRVESQNFPLIGATIGLFRITNNRPAADVSREFATEAGIRGVQFNFPYHVQDQKTPTEGDPAICRGKAAPAAGAYASARHNVTITVIDSIDIKHPELANTISDSFDALSSKEGPHVTAPALQARLPRMRLMGSAPEARILAIRALPRHLAVRRVRPTSSSRASTTRCCTARRSSI